MEFFNHPKFNNESDHRLWDRNKIQMELVKRMYGKDAGAHMLEWIDEHGKRFGEIFKEHLKKDTDFLSHFETNSEAVLDQIEEEMGLMHGA